MGIKNWSLNETGGADGEWDHETGLAAVAFGIDDKGKRFWQATVHDRDGGLVGAKVFSSRIDGMLWCEKQLAALAAKQAA